MESDPFFNVHEELNLRKRRADGPSRPAICESRSAWMQSKKLSAESHS